jgi:RecJ-like exonuclease
MKHLTCAVCSATAPKCETKEWMQVEPWNDSVCEGCQSEEEISEVDRASREERSRRKPACPKCKGKGAIPNPESFIWTICECRRKQ